MVAGTVRKIGLATAACLTFGAAIVSFVDWADDFRIKRNEMDARQRVEFLASSYQIGQSVGACSASDLLYVGYDLSMDGILRTKFFASLIKDKEQYLRGVDFGEKMPTNSETQKVCLNGGRWIVAEMQNIRIAESHERQRREIRAIAEDQ